MDRARHRDGRAGRAGATHRQAAVFQAPQLVDPATAAAARARGPSQEQLFSTAWRHVGQHQESRGHKWLPLPAKAPAVEGSLFRFAKSDRIGLEVADLLLKALYEDDCNNIADKRRQVLHCLARSPTPDAKEYTQLKLELGGLMANVGKKIKEIYDSTGYKAYLPEYFAKFPVLDE